MDVRGHHLVHLFQYLKEGKPDVPHNEIYKFILSFPEITVIDSLDYICSKCGDEKRNSCERDPRLSKKDREIAKEAGLEIGQLYSSSELIGTLMGKKELGTCKKYSGKSLIAMRYRR